MSQEQNTVIIVNLSNTQVHFAHAAIGELCPVLEKRDTLKSFLYLASTIFMTDSSTITFCSPQNSPYRSVCL